MVPLIVLALALIAVAVSSGVPAVSPKLIRSDPSLLGVCASALTATDVQVAAAAVLARVEDTLRRAKCSPGVFAGVPAGPRVISVANPGGLNTYTDEMLKSDRVGAVFVTSLAQAGARLVASAEQCRLEWDALAAIINATTQHMANVAACGALERDILRNRMAAGTAGQMHNSKDSSAQSTIGGGYARERTADSYLYRPVAAYHGPSGVPYTRESL